MNGAGRAASWAAGLLAAVCVMGAARAADSAPSAAPSTAPSTAPPTSLANPAEPAANTPPAPTGIDTGPVPVRERPLWELGLGLSALRLPDYRGADQSHNYLVPFPYIVYRGKWLRSDRDGMRAMLFDSPRVKLDLSFGAAAPSRSNNVAREGMPELRANAEIGPSLNINLGQSAQKFWKLDLRLPVRAAISVERSPRYVGTTFSPNLNLDLTGLGEARWNVGLLTGPLFANRKFHAQYYDVDPAYATAQRPAYSARGGYAGWQTIASTSRRFGNTWVAGFVRHESLRGAVYEDSPLVRRNSALTVGLAMSWVLFTSSEQVASGE